MEQLIKDILGIYIKNTKYISELFPLIRYAFTIDTPSANTVCFRTKYYGNWKDNVIVSFSFGDDFFRIYIGDDGFKSKDLNHLNDLLNNLHKRKVDVYGNYLTHEYTDELGIKKLYSKHFKQK